MRLARLESGHRLPQKLLMWVMRLVMGDAVPDVVRTLLYRREFFGKPFSAMLHPLMRQSREWSDGECELFAAFVSRQNQCPF